MGKDKDRPVRAPRGLGGLADALLKAGVASEKEARRAGHEKRVEATELGADGLARQQAEREAAFLEARRSEAEAARSRQRLLDDAERSERARALIRANLESSRGPKRWFYVARDGRIPYLEVTDTVARQLGEGRAAVVESLEVVPDRHVVVNGEQAAAELAAIDPDLVRFWNRPGRGD